MGAAQEWRRCASNPKLLSGESLSSPIIRHPSSISRTPGRDHGWALGNAQWAVRGGQQAAGREHGGSPKSSGRSRFAMLSGLLLADRQTNVKRQYHLCSGTIHLAAILCPVLSTVTRNSRKPFVWISLPDAETITAHRHSQLSCSMICAPGPVVFQ